MAVSRAASTGGSRAIDMHEIIRTEKIRDCATRRFCRIIATQDLKAVDRLPESEPTDHFGVNPLSARDATTTLEFLGIVRSKLGLWLSVGELDLQRIGERVGAHPTVQAAPGRPLIETPIVPTF